MKTGNSKRFDKEWDKMIKDNFNEDGTRKTREEKMKKYEVWAYIQTAYLIEVEAESEAEAKDKAEQAIGVKGRKLELMEGVEIILYPEISGDEEIQEIIIEEIEGE